jgi:hypothetical protein
MAKHYVVAKDHAGHRIYYCGMKHGAALDHIHTPIWQDTKTYAWVFATYRDGAIVAKAEGGRVEEVR